MTVISGPWRNVVWQYVVEIDDPVRVVHWMDVAHREADPCPDVCHICPLCVCPDGTFEIMPSCSGGAIYGIDSCHCDPLDRVPTSGMRS